MKIKKGRISKQKIFLKKKKTESVNMLANDTKRFLQKINLVAKRKMKNVNMHAIYIIVFLKKKKTKGVNMIMKNIKTFLKKKTKSINMLVNNIEIFPKFLSFCRSTKKFGFAGKHKMLCE